jgi:hypothetical protein
MRAPTKVFLDLAETPTVEIRIKRDHGVERGLGVSSHQSSIASAMLIITAVTVQMHVKSDQIDGRLLRILKFVQQFTYQLFQF